MIVLEFIGVSTSLFSEAIQGLVSNIVVLFISLIILSLAWAGNFGLSIYTSTKLVGESLDKNKMIMGVQKIGILVLSLILISVCISLIPVVIVATGMSVDTVVLENISMAVIIGLNVDKIIYYIKQCIEEYKKILGGGDAIV